ncbi:MAG: chloramphenicol phosphotransferase [Alphaproteobacteria bacterium]|jgi:chloramphenicol 3-O phosphotransferase|nr:chloramphenicol phosphotransferase [Alphaproteobacteria bacterium]
MIIFLNGVATSGKTSIIHELQKQASFPLLKLGVDNFLDMMPSDYYGWGPKAKEGIQFVREEDENGPITRVYNGDFGRAILHTIPPVIAKISSRNLHVAVDEVLFHDYYLTEYTKAFKGLTAYCVAIHCDLEELIRREQKRGGFSVGLGRDQINKVHSPTRFYDIEIDTTRTSSADCAKKILEFVEANPAPQGFKKLEAAFGV